MVDKKSQRNRLLKNENEDLYLLESQDKTRKKRKKQKRDLLELDKGQSNLCDD